MATTGFSPYKNYANHGTEGLKDIIRTNYIVVSPVKDEERYIEDTIKSVIGQTITPSKWIIVDDGSIDNTSKIIEKYCNNYHWIKLIRLRRDTQRQPGSAVIDAFNAGYEIIKDTDYDYIVKLDCDLRFNLDYFEGLISKFHENEKLGIASGIYLEKRGDMWSVINMPSYHAAGASKMIRKACFQQIDGFVSCRGWDTVDEIRAQTNSWETRHFEELKFYHLKTEGSGIGQLRTNILHGEVFYLTGGSRFFLFLKIIHRILFCRPLIIAGLMMFWGYLRPLIQKRKLLVNSEEAKFYKQLLNRRIFVKVRELVPMKVK
ncbi:MAG: glycosyltransferase family 2 protein [Leadbetterella sp.]|nr:glycosyltransferase family 2 protein [Leadbetterella sp.]